MVSKVTKVRMTIGFAGKDGKSGGSYMNSNINHDAADENIYEAACAINELQTELADKIYKTVETELSEQ